MLCAAAVADCACCRLMPHAWCSDRWPKLVSVLQHTVVRNSSHTHTHGPFATAMATTKIEKRYWRAWCDELDEKIERDMTELAALEAQIKIVKDRMLANQQQLNELTGKASTGAADATPNQSTLEVKRARIVGIRSVGVQTD